MNTSTLLKATLWDTLAFGMPTWELSEYSEAALQQAVQTAGHYSIKVDPLSNKQLLNQYGFYYCDTLIEPRCTAKRLRLIQHPDATFSKEVDAEQILAIGNGAFIHGRFHRDFNLPKADADQRYTNWLKQLLDVGQVYGLFWRGKLAGFIGYNGSSLVLHALVEECRGKGLAKFWWSVVCAELLAEGYDEVKSSISVSNLAVLNLYASLGFFFSNPQDIYQRMVP
jgi:L-amino acid N-acyltransferase YncA